MYSTEAYEWTVASIAEMLSEPHKKIETREKGSYKVAKRITGTFVEIDFTFLVAEDKTSAIIKWCEKHPRFIEWSRTPEGRHVARFRK